VIRLALWSAIESGEFSFIAGDYDDGGGRLCPLAAAATVAGVWDSQTRSPAHEAWGIEAPSAEVEDFAAYFDLASDETSVQWSIALVSRELETHCDTCCSEAAA